MGHLLTAGCIHHRATGKMSLLEVARKSADYPWNGDIAIEFQLPKPVTFALRLRIPA
jgi:DUF1680 family protein